jgi:hypothetical protein
MMVFFAQPRREVFHVRLLVTGYVRFAFGQFTTPVWALMLRVEVGLY